jgi:hypothetical protein
MNCALVNIINHNASYLSLDAPEIFKANIGEYGAFRTIAGADVQFPEPGKSVDATLGDRHLNEPTLLSAHQVRLPEPAPEVGTYRQSSSFATDSLASRSIPKLKFLFSVFVFISVPCMVL